MTANNQPHPARWPAFGALLTSLLFAPLLVCAQDIEVLALFRDQAVIRIDGQRHTLKAGESTPDGVRLVRTDEQGAVLSTAAGERHYPLGARLRQGYQETQAAAVQVFRDRAGMFSTVGAINGLPVTFMVDTGASTVAMNAAQARRLGIDYRVVGEPGTVVTASQAEPVYRVMLDVVKVGSIELRNVEAVVLEGAQPAQTLLGMSFLGRLEMQNDGQRLTLRKKY